MEGGEIFDLVVVGGGPAGLSASINAESEGVNTDLVEADPIVGGQMGTSSGIENFFGFPEGVTGPELACRGERQARKFTTELQTNTRVQGIRQFEDGFAVVGETPEGLAVVRGRAVLVTAGVEYRELAVPKLNQFLGRGAWYGSPNMQGDYADQEIYIVGGANSAGQAAHFLARQEACKVNVVVRGQRIQDKMSAYLCDRLEEAENIEVHTETEVVAVDGDDRLREAVLSCHGDERTVSLDGLYIMIGAVPKVDWLPDEVRDNHGFIITGSNVDEEARQAFREVNDRAPLPHETIMSGVFAAGDVRSGTIKRVASAVGDGATTIPDIHSYLATLR